MVVALNKSDVTDKKQTEIDEKRLSEKLGCPVVKTVSTSAGHTGLKEAVRAAASLKGAGQTAPYVQADIDLTDKKAVEAADRKRFEFVNGIVKQVEKRKVFTKDKNFQDKVDEIITHKVIGIPIFVAVIFLVFYISQTTLGTWIADWLVGWIETFQGWVGGLMENANPLLYALLVDGIIGGVGAVVGFLPLVMVMYFLIALLEDCGYMARATVVLDPIFKRVGLSGKSVIPMVIGTGCAIPGVMASRTIRNERERRTTAMLTPFMPCGAKIPVIALFAGAFFADAWWVSATMYLVGIVLVLLGALLVKRITGQKYRKSFFIIELPEYKIPSLKRACGLHAGARQGVYHQGRNDHPCVQHGGPDHADLQLAVPAGGGRRGEHIHPCKYRSSLCDPVHPAGIRRMAACSGSDHRIYRERECGRHTCGCIRSNKSDRYG